jgi:hypothetical protein
VGSFFFPGEVQWRMVFVYLNKKGEVIFYETRIFLIIYRSGPVCLHTINKISEVLGWVYEHVHQTIDLGRPYLLLD